tara:strand:- start:314 stop:673 length:360 start_codon:yes stop_codon:yes gene_type:complete
MMLNQEEYDMNNLKITVRENIATTEPAAHAEEYYDEEEEYGDEYYDEEIPVDESYSFREVRKNADPLGRKASAISQPKSIGESISKNHFDSMMSNASKIAAPGNGGGGSFAKNTSTSHS